MQAAPEPALTTSPWWTTVISAPGRPSMSSSDIDGVSPSTNTPDDALSATVSKREMSHPGDAAGAHLDRRDDVGGGGSDIGCGDRRRAADRLAEHERHLRLDTGLEEAVERDRLAVGERHVGVEHTEIGGVDPHLLLHGLRREADLAAHPACGRPRFGTSDDPLDGVPVSEGRHRARVPAPAGTARPVRPPRR